MTKYVYTFGGGSAEGSASDKNLLGGKGANMAEMCSLGIPVPAGFTISTECCTAYYASGCKLPAELTGQVLEALRKVESIMGMKYGDTVNPLLVSCRSGARSSMPGMMDTVLNVGLCAATIPGMIAKTNNPRFVWDSYRRLIMMYADVVMEKAEGLDPALGKGIRKILDEKLDEIKRAKGQEAIAAEWAERARALLSQPRLNIADAMALSDVEIESLDGSARASMSVSERPLVFLPSSLRWSYPITSATAGCPGRATESCLAALFTSGVLAATAATDWWKYRYAPPAAPLTSTSEATPNHIAMRPMSDARDRGDLGGCA